MGHTGKPLDQKTNILNAAFRALKQYGLPHLSYDTIAKEADLSRQVVRYHFKDADTLMVALSEHLAAGYRESLVSVVMQAKGEQRLNLFIDYFLNIRPDFTKPEDDRVFDALFALTTGSQPVRTALQAQYTLLGQVLTHEFMLQYPHLPATAAEELSFLFISIMEGHWKMVATLGFSEDHKHVTRQAMERLIESYTNNHEPSGPLDTIWKRSPEE
jgi:AcrR family transcriptional regulator